MRICLHLGVLFVCVAVLSGMSRADGARSYEAIVRAGVGPGTDGPERQGPVQQDRDSCEEDESEDEVVYDGQLRCESRSARTSGMSWRDLVFPASLTPTVPYRPPIV